MSGNSKDSQSPDATSQKLIIVESPGKIKTITKFLDKNFKVVSTVGHIKDLPEKKVGVSFDEKTGAIDLEYVALDGKQTVISEICKQASKCSEVYLASDPDREGEIIAWHIGEEIAKTMKGKGKIYRISFNEITKPAILEAVSNKGNIDMPKVASQQARRVLDRWVGYEVSPLLWRKITKGLSAGRVQSAAVLIICNREDEIRIFKPEESWSIHILFGIGKETLLAELFKIKQKAAKIKNEKDATEILSKIEKTAFSITTITEKDRLRNALPPFMTSTLQQDAYNKLGFSVDKTMMLAQKLYEGVPLTDPSSPEALITYMRTDSLRISDTALEESKKFIISTYGKEFYPSKTNIFAKAGAQDAHEAVRPISVNISPEKVTACVEPDLAKLYKLIWQRFVSSQMAPAKYFQRQVLIDGNDFTLKATGSTLVFEGCLAVYSVEEEGDEEQTTKIPKAIAPGLALNQKEASKKQHFTQPPARYTEATMIKELEKRGIGRPSTFMATLSTIQKRGYVKKNLKRFQPTELGETVNKFLVQNLPDIFNVTFTATMEEDLDKIANNEAQRDVVLTNFYKKLKDDLTALGEVPKGKTTVVTDVNCEKCSKKMAIRFGKGQQFLGCTGFPECTSTSRFERNEQGEIKLIAQEPLPVLDEKCPKCSSAMIARVGRFGPFIACSGYPKCAYIKQEIFEHPCPVDGGQLGKKSWKNGVFWGCNNHPKCTVAFSGEVRNMPCPECNTPFLVYSAKTGLKCQKTGCSFVKAE
jgi:DNA topoisomerase-1